MIIKKKEHWFRMLFVWQGSVLPGLLPRLILLFLLSLIVVYFHGSIFSFKIPLNPVPLTLFGFVLALFLGFKNNASYERFWEARKLWGAILNITRSLTRQSLTLVPKNSEEKNASVAFVKLLSCFTHSLKHQLRDTDPLEHLKKHLSNNQLKLVMESRYKPVLIIQLLAEWVQQMKDQNKIDSILQARFDENLNNLTDIVGGCERIKSTLIPYSYSVLLHRTVYIYCFLLPFGLLDTLGWFTPFIVVFIAYTFVAFEAIADEIEEPFGTKANDLALSDMCEMIDSTIFELVGITTDRTSKKQNVILE